jgi:hypothetical protein
MAWVEPTDFVEDEFVVPLELNTMQDNLRALSPRGLSVQIGTAGGGAIAPGVKLYIPVHAPFKINGWSLAADQAGSISLNVYKDVWANAPPDVADTIVGAEPPSLVAQQFARDLELTTWTVNVDAGDVLAIVVDSAATVECVVFTLHAVPR